MNGSAYIVTEEAFKAAGRPASPETEADTGIVTAGAFVTVPLVGVAKCPTGGSDDATLTTGDRLTAGGKLNGVEVTPLELAKTAAAAGASSAITLPGTAD